MMDASRRRRLPPVRSSRVASELSVVAPGQKAEMLRACEAGVLKCALRGR